MAKRKRDRLTSEAQPTATNVDFPVFVPNAQGDTNIEVGKARLRYGTLVVEFENTAVSVTIQNMIERGVLLGLGMIMLKPDVVNNMYQEIVSDEEDIEKAKNKALEAGLLITNDEGKVVPMNSEQDYDEIINVFRHLDQIAVEEPVQENNFEIVADPEELDNLLSVQTNEEVPKDE